MPNLLVLIASGQKRLLLSLLERKGSVSVEVSLIFIPLVSIILLIFELCRIVYISSALDLAVAEASRYAAISTSPSEDYRKVFFNKLKKDIPLFPLLAKDDSLYIEVKYCNSVSDIINETCNNDASKKKLAIYHVGYNYTLLFSFFSLESVDSYLQRTVIYVQEYQRDDI